MATPWQDLINFLFDGENVSASVTNRPSRQLAERTQYLYERLQLLAAGEALYIHSVPVESTAVPGDAMYFDDVTGTPRALLDGTSLTSRPSNLIRYTAGTLLRRVLSSSGCSIQSRTQPLAVSSASVCCVPSICRTRSMIRR